MAIEVYIPTEARFENRPLAGARVLTLYDAESTSPHGSMTLSTPPAAETRGGPLEVLGRRDDKVWHVLISDIRVRRATAVGIEFDVLGPIERQEAVSDGE